MIKPKISIVTVTFNCADKLERAITSIISQNYENLEYIIVDGGSTDGTLEIIKKFNDRISTWISEPDRGISDAFNKGISLSTGEIIGLINSDDGLEKNALNIISQAYEKDVDVYRGNVILWREETNTKVIIKPSMKFGFSGMHRTCHQGTFITKKAYDRYGMYDENCKYMMDYDLLLRFYEAGAKMKHIDAQLAFNSLGGITSAGYTMKREEELKYVLHKNGANRLQIKLFSFVRKSKRMVKRIIGTDKALKIRYR